MADVELEGELLHLMEDFVRLSQLRFEKPKCVFTWSVPEFPIPTEAWECVALQNCLYAHYMDPNYIGVGYSDGVRECEMIRDEVLSGWSSTFGVIEVLSQGKACLWWSAPVGSKFRHHFERLSVLAIRITEAFTSQPMVVSDDAPATQWLNRARQIIRSDEWCDSQDKVIVEVERKPICEELIAKWNNYPSRPLCSFNSEVMCRVSVLDHLEELVATSDLKRLN